MNELEKIKNELASGEKGENLKNLATSRELANIGKTVDPEAIKKAVSSGDQEAIGRILQQVLATQDGQALLKKVGESFGEK